VKAKVHHCHECGCEIERKGPRSRPPKFCSDAHRKAFNNRRMTRGAVLYDEVMKWRYDRANNKDAVALISQLAAIFRGKDERLRDGRPSWIDKDPTRDVLTVAMESD
jgi:hypothetical protein